MAKYRNFKRKASWKRIVSIVLVTVLVVSLGGTLISFLAKNSKTIPSSVFSVGGLNEEGTYSPTEHSIYTKEAFECIGLRVQPDFESQVTYDVYYYDYDERLVEVKKGLSSVYDEDFPLAQYCRIVIHPEIPEGTAKADFKIKWYEVSKYANDIKITVDRKQEYLYGDCVNLYVDENSTKNTGFIGIVGEAFNISTDDSMRSVKCSEKITIEPSWKYIDVYFRNVKNNNLNSQAVVVTDADNIVVAKGGFTDLNPSMYVAEEWNKVTIEIPREYEGLSLYIRMYEDIECYAFGY